MEETIVSIPSAGLRLHGALGTPAGLRPGEKRAAFLVLHGFGTNSDSEGVRQPTRVLSEFGYVTLRPTPDAWAKFTAMLEDGRAYRARTGTSLMVPRDAIVPIPSHVRERLDKQKVEMLATNAVEMFPAETAQSMFDFRAEDVVGKIAPRPLLLIHAANDSVTPTEQSVALFERAGQPAELHLFSGVDHFLFNENSARVWSVLRGWLDAYFPARA
jgi:fermentation-respiration switch protein FrsA (DUF1100 family)